MTARMNPLRRGRNDGARRGGMIGRFFFPLPMAKVMPSGPAQRKKKGGPDQEPPEYPFDMSSLAT